MKRKNSKLLLLLTMILILSFAFEGLTAYAQEWSDNTTTAVDASSGDVHKASVASNRSLIAWANHSGAIFSNNQLEFHNIYSAQMNGEIKITGNTLRMPDKKYYSSTQIDAYGKTGLAAGGRGTSMNNNLYMGELDEDNDPDTRNSSAADVQINNSARIEKAFLVWGGSSAAGDLVNGNGKMTGKTPQESPKAAPEDEVLKGPVIKFKTPKMDTYTVINPIETNRIRAYKNDYTAYADVTKLLQEGGAGTYWAGDLPLSTGYDTYGGWSLVIVYKDDTCPQNDLNVFFGHRIIDKSTLAEIQIDNLVTPPTGPVHSSIGMVLWESDEAGNGDYIAIGKDANSTHRKISDVLNSEENMASSTVTYKGKVVLDRNPDYINTHGMDAKVLELVDYMENRQTSLHIRAGSNGDVYYPTIFTSEIELYKPNVTVEKSVKNITRPDASSAMEGDTLEYTIRLKNLGYDTATCNTATDVLSANVDYIADSIKCLKDGNWGAKTDASNDDEVTYYEGEKKIVFHFGDGANADKGGTLRHEQETAFSYRVKVNGSNESETITNTVHVEFANSDEDKDKGGSSSDSSTVPYEPANPDFSFTKSADKNELVLGEVITYTFTIKNTGNVTLSDLTLDDPMEGLSEIKLEKSELKPGESTSGTATYTVTQTDVDKGQVENTATVSGNPPVNNGEQPPVPIKKTSTVRVPNDPKEDYEFKKTANMEKAVLGEVITYTFTVKNTGNVTLSNLTLDDPMLGLGNYRLDKTTLKPGETAKAIATYKVTQPDVDKGRIVNTATVTGTPPQKDGDTPSEPITKTSTVTVTVEPKKTSEPSKPSKPRKPDQPQPDGKDGDPPDLNMTDHYSYIVGYPEDYRTGEPSSDEALWPVKPQGKITRAEVASIFYRLLKEEVRAEVTTTENSFSDVAGDDWFNETVSSLAAMDIIAGYEDGTFRPNASITRAEFAAIAARFFENNDVAYNKGLFKDIAGNEWYADIVASAVGHGLISGYPDGSMQPNLPITRAESCAVINRTIDRRPHKELLAPVEEMRIWPDNQPDTWYYADMQEATNGHYYKWVTMEGETYEKWTKVDLEYDWTKR